jgi:protein subunit release factor B
MGANTRSAAAFAVHPKMIAPQQQQRTVWNALFTPNMVLSASSNNSNENDEVKPTWEYVPFDPKKKPPAPRRKPINRNFSSTPAPWTVPKTVTIPEDRLEVSFVRSSGSGGQNVNKLSTKVELRLDLKARQSWMPAEVQRRLKEEQSNKISKEGILSITAQEHRTQGMNRKSAVDKLRKMVLAAWPRPKIRKQRKGISRAAKARNKEFKKRRSDTKQNRKKVDW